MRTAGFWLVFDAPVGSSQARSRGLLNPDQRHATRSFLAGGSLVENENVF